MSSSALAAGLHHLRGQLAGQERKSESDEQLLHAFTTRRDDSAFAVLVRRHGPMVLHVCRRVLGQQQDAEDVFQATFLVLANRAASLRDKTALASWLHGTAYRTSMKAKQAAARRRKYENQTPARQPANPADEMLWREVRTLLDEEIARLPEKYRSVFVLCCLEELSQTETARRLGLKVRTAADRLAAARKRLAQRLARRGVELTAVLATVGLAASSASALPAGLISTTMKAALATTAGEGLTGIVSASVAELVQGTSAAVMASKAKIGTVILLTVTLLGGVGANLLSGGRQFPESPSSQGANAPRSGKHDTTKTVEIRGRVFAPDGKPRAGAKLLLLGASGKIQQLGVTEADGRFTVAIPKEAKKDYLLVQVEGTGVDFLALSRGFPSQPVEFHLVKDKPIRGRVINTEGKPVAGVRVTVATLNVYADNSLDSFLNAWKKRDYTSGVPVGERHLWTESAVLLPATTDAEGRFVLRGIGKERFASLRLSGAGIADETVWVVNRDGFDPTPYNQALLDNTLKGHERQAAYWMLHGPEVAIVAESEKPIRGIVADVDSGKCRPGVVVRLTRINRGELVHPIVEATTDVQGRYEIHGARKTKRYMLEVAADRNTGHMSCQVWTDDTPGYQPVRADIKVKVGVIITGTIIDKATGKPIPGFAAVGILNNNPFAKEYPELTSPGWMRTEDRCRSDDGKFRVVAIPGPVILMGGASDAKTNFQFQIIKNDPEYPQYFSKDPRFRAYFGFGGGMAMIQGNYCKVLKIEPGVKIVEQDIVLERASALPLRIQDADGKPLSGVLVAGLSSEDWHNPIRCDQDESSVYQLESGKPRTVVFFHPTRKLAGALTLKGDEKAPVAVKLAAPGALKARLLDPEGKPLAGVVIELHYRQRAAAKVHDEIYRAKPVTTDAQGAFAFEDLIPDQKFELYFHRGKRNFERAAKLLGAAIEVKSGEHRDLGAIKLKLAPE